MNMYLVVITNKDGFKEKFKVLAFSLEDSLNKASNYYSLSDNPNLPLTFKAEKIS